MRKRASFVETLMIFPYILVAVAFCLAIFACLIPKQNNKIFRDGQIAAQSFVAKIGNTVLSPSWCKSSPALRSNYILLMYQRFSEIEQHPYTILPYDGKHDNRNNTFVLGLNSDQNQVLGLLNSIGNKNFCYQTPEQRGYIFSKAENTLVEQAKTITSVGKFEAYLAAGNK